MRKEIKGIGESGMGGERSLLGGESAVREGDG